MRIFYVYSIYYYMKARLYCNLTVILPILKLLLLLLEDSPTPSQLSRVCNHCM
jgi:hypothetical protein